LYRIPGYASQIKSKKPLAIPTEMNDVAELMKCMLDFDVSTRATMTDVVQMLNTMKNKNDNEI
jgi:hypothetical protein